MTFNCPKGILGLGGGGGGGASKNKLKDTSLIFSMTNITILSIFRTHALKEYCKVVETKGIYILNNLVRTSDTLIGYLPIFQMLPKTFLCIRYH